MQAIGRRPLGLPANGTPPCASGSANAGSIPLAGSPAARTRPMSRSRASSRASRRRYRLRRPTCCHCWRRLPLPEADAHALHGRTARVLLEGLERSRSIRGCEAALRGGRLSHEVMRRCLAMRAGREVRAEWERSCGQGGVGSRPKTHRRPGVPPVRQGVPIMEWLGPVQRKQRQAARRLRASSSAAPAVSSRADAGSGTGAA